MTYTPRHSVALGVPQDEPVVEDATAPEQPESTDADVPAPAE